MEAIIPVYIPTRKEWRAWLEKNSASAPGVWLQFFKKHTGKRMLPYADAVEEALCFGWIDSTIRRLDDERYMQKFTPRRKRSLWSEINCTRMEKLIAAGLVTDAGLAVYDRSKPPFKSALRGLPPIPVPADLKRALAASLEAKANFPKLTEKYRQMCLRWITAAKKPETRARRVAEFVEATSRNERIGMK